MTENKLFRRRPLAVAVLTAVNFVPIAQANPCISLTALNAASTQNFDTLANTGTTSTVVPQGWAFSESGSAANTSYAIGTGSIGTGNTYSFGASGSTERAFGGLLSGSLIPTIGACYTNNTGSSITGLSIAYTGEQWRAGVTNRGTADRIDFQYSLNATSLTGGTWTDVNALDFNSPNINTTLGLLDGNAAANRSAISGTVSSLSIPQGASFWIRWTDFDISPGADDGLAVDDFSLTPVGVPPAPNLSINDVTQVEGNSGATTLTFTVSLSAPAPAGGVDFNVATADGTATAGSDYVARSLTGQTIPQGSSTFTFDVTVNGDTTFEPNETFFVNVTGVAGATVSDGQGQGTIQNDDNECGLTANKISEVQGGGASTPLAGQTVTIEGIVVGDFQGTSANSLQGFFVQEEDADADGVPATSEGIFVFDGAGGTNVNVGDKVRVVGTAGEFNAITQLSGLTSVQVCGAGQTIPSITPVDLPVPGVPNGNLAAATTAVNNYFEPFESMLVRFPDKLKVSEYFQLDRFGQIVLRQGGRVPSFTSTHNPSVNGNINHQITLMRRQIVLDDGNDTSNYYSTNNLPLPYPTGGLSTSNRFRGGDTIANLSGVLQLRFGAWRIRPVEELFDYLFTPANPRKPNPPTVGGNLKVAAFNLLNYFTTIDTTASSTSGPCGPNGLQDCRGADSVAELIRQTDKAAAALCGMDADIIGLMELENNATASSQALVDAANARCGAGLSFIHTGAIGGDAIKVGLFYKPARVSPTGTTAILDSLAFVNGGDGSERNRPALAQSFTAGGQTFTVIVNHLKSKGSPCDAPDAGDGQGNCNQVRTNAANALLAWLATNPTGLSVPDPDYLIVGDLNSYAQEDPIKALEAAGYTNLVKKFSGNKAYSFVFDGQTGYLDYALSSASLTPQVTGTREWHINADEPPMFDYNDDVLDTGEASFEKKSSARPLYEANPYRSSDHDPVIVGLQLGGVVNTINGNSGRNTLTGTAGRDRITGFAGADTLTGNGGNDEFVYTSLVDGIDTIMDFAVGSDRIDLSALLSAIGYQGGNPLSDGIVQFATAGGNAVVHIDSDGTAGPAGRRMMIIVRGVSAAALNNPANFIF